MDARAERKWDRAAARFDLMSGLGPERRWRPIKRELFSHMGAGKILFVAVGSGLDFEHFSPGRDILGIDISKRMLEKAAPRAALYEASGGSLELRQMDVESLEMPDGSFEQAFTSCTFCSVTRPVEGLREIFRVLRPGGALYMFEHTGSRYFPFNLMLHAMTPLSRRLGPDLNRPTVENVTRAGFELREVQNYFLDVVKTIYATRPAAAVHPSTGKASSFSR
jgi:ubiquinone/menaquinone biosynthesis C-methylase UbiE